MADKPVIGWIEYLDFPEWGIRGVKAKIDTGARTSALHVERLVRLKGNEVQFDVMYSRRRPFKKRTVKAAALRWSRVRSSTGEYSERCFIRTRIRLGDMEKDIELSLVSRENMLFRMLLGRQALGHHFLVDPGRRNILTERPRLKRKRRKAKPVSQ